MSKDLSRSLRLTQLQNYLSMKSPSGGVTIKEIADYFGLTKRQIYRDLDDIENTLNMKLIRPKRGQKETGKYKLDENLPLKIGPETAAIIFLSILRQKGSPLAPKINEIKDLLIAALYKNRYGSSQDNIEELQNKIHIVEEQLLNEEKPGQVLLKLMEAIKECKVVRIKYLKTYSNEYSKRNLEPYGLTCKHNNWYLVGFCKNSQARKTFRVDLIDDVYILNEKFQYPKDFCLNDYFGNSWGIYSDDQTKKISIKVKPELAYRFKLISYHPSQKIERELTDGSIVVSYETSGINEFLGWILQWAEFVEILEPEDLRTYMRQKLEQVIAKYSVNH